MNNTLALALALTACTTTETPDAPPIPDGLTVVERTSDHLSGTFGKDGVGIRVEITTSPRQISIFDADGMPLIESALAGDGSETMSILGGRETIVGRSGAENPTITGDETAHADLTQLPEAELIPAMLGALAKSDVPEEIYRGSPGIAQGTFQAFTLYCGQTAYLPTYSIWWSHTFVRYDTHPTIFGHIHVEDFWAIWDELLLPGWYYNDYGPRWNFTLKVTNKCSFGNAPVRVGSDAY
jgi:hypothetical protein